MNLPRPGDYIDIHTHDARPAAGIFVIENLMAHEDRLPEDDSGFVYSYGIHPWFLNEKNHNQLISSVENSVNLPNMIAIGEAGFDKLRGPSQELQREVFEEQVEIAEAHAKPVIIHCVRAWDELLEAHKKAHPKMPWLIHGFRGKKELAAQLLSKGMYLSFWFDFVIKPESSGLIKSLPTDRIFLETDGAEVDIREIYKKVAGDLNISVGELKAIVLSNFNLFFNQPAPKEGGANNNK
ncbi:MAG: TatD family hydrolase [Bacteroidota bacterium]